MVYIQQAANAAITGAIGSSGFSSPPIAVYIFKLNVKVAFKFDLVFI